MLHYEEFLAEIKSHADENYKNFHSKLLNNSNINLIGVRTPILRSIAKKHEADFVQIFSFPDDFYEVTFIKLAILSSFEFKEFIKYVEKAVSLLNNWATCDCFKAKCIANHKQEFLPYITNFIQSDKEYTVRYALTTLLNFYVEKKFLKFILKSVEKSDKTKYYIRMACAWLVAEVLVKHYDEGVEFLKSNVLDKKTRNKSIQKAVESYRISPEQKSYLKTLKV